MASSWKFVVEDINVTGKTALGAVVTYESAPAVNLLLLDIFVGCNALAH